LIVLRGKSCVSDLEHPHTPVYQAAGNLVPEDGKNGVRIHWIEGANEDAALGLITGLAE
jgi:hypothetical protein